MRASAISCRVVSAFMAIALGQGNAQVAKTQWRRVADQIRPKPPELAGFMDEGEDVLVLRARCLGVRERTLSSEREHSAPNFCNSSQGTQPRS
jgi:hypothetical protein